MCWSTKDPNLVECTACKRVVSAEASACPGCGHPRVPRSAAKTGNLIRCPSCNTPHAIDATACPKCGQPHDPVATRAGIEAEKATRGRRAVPASGNTVTLVFMLVVAVAAMCCMSQPREHRVEHVTVPDHIAAPLPAERP